MVGHIDTKTVGTTHVEYHEPAYAEYHEPAYPEPEKQTHRWADEGVA